MTTFIVHSLSQAILALTAARDAGVPVTLRSPSEGAQSMGPLFFRALAEAALDRVPGAQATAMLDCGDAPGLALAALRSGIKAVRVDVLDSTLAKLRDIAAQMNAKIYAPGEDGAILDLATCPDMKASAARFLERNDRCSA